MSWASYFRFAWHFSNPAYNELRIVLFLSKREKLTFYFEKSEHIGLVVYWLTPVWAGRPRPRVSPLTLNSAPAPARVLISPKLRVVSHPTPGSSTARDNTDNSRHSKYIHVQLQKLCSSLWYIKCFVWWHTVTVCAWPPLLSADGWHAVTWPCSLQCCKQTMVMHWQKIKSKAKHRNGI